MDIREFGRGVGEMLAYGLGVGKAESEVNRPPVMIQDEVHGPVIKLDDDPKDKKAVASVYFYSNMRVLSQKLGSAQLYVKIREGERTEPVEDHEFERLFRRPNFLFSRSDLMEHSMWWLGLNGNAYWWLAPYADGSLAEIWPIPANEITAVPCKKEVISHYVWRPGGRKLPPIEKERIAHFRMVNPYSVTAGMSFIAALRYALEGSAARFKWELEFFSEQRAVPEGLLSVAPETKPGDVARIRKELQETYGGGKRRIAVGRAGQMDFKRFTLTQEEMAFLDRLRYDEKLFDRVFGFPGGYWDAKANRANAEQAERSLAQDTVMPLLNKFAGNIETQILNLYYETEGEITDLMCEFENLVPQDKRTDMAEFKTYSPVLTFNEARAMAGYQEVGSELGDMPVALVPALVQLVGQGLEQMPVVENKMLDDLRNWKKVALREMSKGKRPDERKFHSDHISADSRESIEKMLKGAATEAQVMAAFDELIKGVKTWQDYP